MTDFNKILDKAKELETKMKESQKNIKNSFPDAELIDVKENKDD